MKPITNILLLYALTHTICGYSFAQSDGWTVVTLAADTLESCTIGEVNNNRVDLIRGTGVVQIPVDSIGMLFRIKESSFWRGAGYGTLAGGGVGA